MGDVFERTKVLITVMTYPHPSRSYQELVCTAGITEAGEWVRLYPIDYRYRSHDQQFHKYQWVEIGLAPRGRGNDNRKESRKPELESIRILGPPLPPDDGWRIVDSLPVHTLNQLRRLYDEDKTSLGIVRPKRIIDMAIEEADPKWKSGWRTILNQMRLFGPQPKPLAKIPYKFSYIFDCEDDEKPHTAMNEGWELGVLFLNELDRLGSKEKAAASVRAKFFDEMCAVGRETKFFMGTVFPYNAWVVVGVFWPPGAYQLGLKL